MIVRKVSGEVFECCPEDNEVSKVVKLCLHNIHDNDLKVLNEVFRLNSEIVQTAYYYMKNHGYMIVKKYNGKVPSTEYAIGSGVEKDIIRRVGRDGKVTLGSRVATLLDWKGLPTPYDFTMLQIKKVIDVFKATWLSALEKGEKPSLPSKETIDSLSNVVWIRVTKSNQKRDLTLQLYVSGKSSLAKITSPSQILDINGEAYLLAEFRISGFRSLKFPIFLTSINDEVKELFKNAEEFGDPSQIVKKENNYYLHLVISRKFRPRSEIKRVLAIDVGWSRWFVYAVVYDLEQNKILHVYKVRIGHLLQILDKLLAVEKRRLEWKPKLHKLQKLLRKFKIHLINRVERNKPVAKVYSSFLETFNIPRKPRYDDLLKVTWTIDDTAIRWIKPRPETKDRVREINHDAMPKTETGESLYQVVKRNFMYKVVNDLIRICREHNVDVIVIEYLEGLRTRIISKIENRIKELWSEYQVKKDYELLRRKEILEKIKERLSRFPYRQFMLDLINEAWWNDVKVLMVSPTKTSITCPRCGYVNKANRPTRNLFKCVKCKYTDSPDRVACINMAKKIRQTLTIPIAKP